MKEKARKVLGKLVWIREGVLRAVTFGSFFVSLSLC